MTNSPKSDSTHEILEEADRALKKARELLDECKRREEIDRRFLLIIGLFNRKRKEWHGDGPDTVE